MTIEDAECHVALTTTGDVIYTEDFEEEFEGDLDLLHCCIIDHIHEYESISCSLGYFIDWESVVLDYRECSH